VAIYERSRPAHLRISVRPEGQTVTVAPSGDLDIASSDVLEDEVRALRAQFAQMVIDLSQVAFMDSSGLRVLLTLRNDAARDGDRLELVPGPRHVQRIFELTATDKLFEWRAEREAL
jgi:anti-anti-sigma factor